MDAATGLNSGEFAAAGTTWDAATHRKERVPEGASGPSWPAVELREGWRWIAGAYRDYALSDLTIVNYQLSMDHADLAALVTMGPSARHVTSASLATRIRAQPSPARSR
jgi:hypothetical protein